MQNLVNAGLGNSLEAQLLAAGLIGRSVDISQTDDPNFVANFFAAKVEEVVENPPPAVPEPGTLVLIASALTTLVFARSGRRPPF